MEVNDELLGVGEAGLPDKMDFRKRNPQSFEDCRHEEMVVLSTVRHEIHGMNEVDQKSIDIKVIYSNLCRSKTQVNKETNIVKTRKHDYVDRTNI